MDVRPVTGDGRRFEIHAFNCTKGPSCPVDGATEELHAALKGAVANAGLKGEVRVNHSGCLDQCGHGPVLVVYPEGVWYSHLKPEDATRIVDEHFVSGKPVEDLLFKTEAPGKGKLPKKAGEPQDPTQPGYNPCTRCPW